MQNISFTKKIILSLMAVGMFFTSTPNAESANLKGLSYMGSYVEFHPTTQEVHLPFMEQVEKDTNGEITFNYFSKNTLYPESEEYAVLNDGRVDFGVFRSAYYPGVVNLMSVIDIPGMAPNAITGSLLAADVMAKFPEISAEFPKESVPFTVWASASYQIHTIDPVKNLSELKGKKIIVWDALTLEIAQMLGANPIRLSSTDTYLSLSKGMADGVLCPLAPVRSFKISDVAKYHLLLDVGVSAFNMSIFKGLWDDFSPEQQKYFTENGWSKYALAAGQSLDNGAMRDVEWMKELGHEFYTPTDEERQEMLTMLAPFKENWLKKMEGYGHKNAAEILKYAEERSKYYQDEFAKGTYSSASQN